MTTVTTKSRTTVTATPRTTITPTPRNQVHDPSERRRQPLPAATLTQRGIYLTRPAALLLPPYTRFVLLRKDPNRKTLLILKCKKNDLGARTLQRSKRYGYARVGDATLFPWLDDAAGKPGTFFASPTTLGIQLELNRPIIL